MTEISLSNWGIKTLLVGTALGAAGAALWCIYSSDDNKEQLLEVTEDFKYKALDFSGSMKERLEDYKDNASYFLEGFLQVASEYIEEAVICWSEKQKVIAEKLNKAYAVGKKTFLKKKEELEIEFAEN